MPHPREIQTFQFYFVQHWTWKFSTVYILFFYVALTKYISSMTHALQKYCTVHECSCSAAWILQAFWHHLRSFYSKPWLTSVLVLATRTATITRPQCRKANPWIFLCPGTQQTHLTLLEILLSCSIRNCSSSFSHIWTLGWTHVVLYHNILSISYCAIFIQVSMQHWRIDYKMPRQFICTVCNVYWSTELKNLLIQGKKPLQYIRYH